MGKGVGSDLCDAVAEDDPTQSKLLEESLVADGGHAVADDQGFAYDLQSLGWDGGVAAVQVGQADALIAGATIKQERIDSGWIFSDG